VQGKGMERGLFSLRGVYEKHQRSGVLNLVQRALDTWHLTS
jgi:hypothetical protein